MLVLTRKAGQTLNIDGRIKVHISEIRGESVRLAIEAPAEVEVHRQEVWEAIQREKAAK